MKGVWNGQNDIWSFSRQQSQVAVSDRNYWPHLIKSSHENWSAKLLKQKKGIMLLIETFETESMMGFRGIEIPKDDAYALKTFLLNPPQRQQSSNQITQF